MLSQPPSWLEDAPELRALLDAVVDRFDQQSGASRARNIVIAAEKYLHGLARNDANADNTWALVRDLDALHVLVIRSGRRSPYDSPWLGAKLKFAPDVESTLRAWLSRPAAPSASERWRAAVSRFAHAIADRGAALSLRRISLPGRTDEEVVAAFASLANVDRVATLRQLSAHVFWGDSKVLDDRADLVAASFPRLCVRDRKIIVAAHLPLQIDSVLFIENQDTYASAADGVPVEVARHAVVYMSGFRGAAARVRSTDGAVLHFAGPGCVTHAAEFSAWWFRKQAQRWPVYFWGDLDFAGMQILKSLRTSFDEARAWLPGYEIMLAALRDGGARVAGAESGQVDPVTTGCSYADDVLLPAIRNWGFRDQERI